MKSYFSMDCDSGLVGLQCTSESSVNLPIRIKPVSRFLHEIYFRVYERNPF